MGPIAVVVVIVGAGSWLGLVTSALSVASPSSPHAEIDAASATTTAARRRRRLGLRRPSLRTYLEVYLVSYRARRRTMRWRDFAPLRGDPTIAGHVRTHPGPAPPLLPLGPRVEREDARQGPGHPRRHGVPRPRGRGRAAREGGGPGQGRRRHQEPGLGRQGPVRPGQRLGHRVDRLRRHRGRRQRRRAPRGDHAARRCSRPAEVVALDLLLTQVEKNAGLPDRPHRHRGPDRDGPRPHQRRGDLRRVAPARDDHPRPGRHRRRRWRCRRSPAACRSPSTPATTSTTCSSRSSWPAGPTACRSSTART